jgi:hypothetical protein
MGLDTSHNCWHGAYSAFMRWRQEIAKVAGVPLMLMEHYYRDGPSKEALAWMAPRDGGPQCADYRGPEIFHWTEEVMRWLPIRWAALKPSPLHVLLDHSDCDGSISASDCAPLADALEELLPLLNGDGGGHIGDYRTKTEQFIAGLRDAASKGEDVEFH